jgi:predicted metal-dependent HD superfamily phosphohydrolase
LDELAMTGRVDIDRFQSLWCRCLLDKSADNSADVHRRLVKFYEEPQRVYHTLNHIEHCLSFFDKISGYLNTPDAIELAIWFHDVIYEPGATDNELLSADLFMEITQGLFDDSLRQTVYDNIMATLHDGSNIETNDSRFMVDIDLSSFALPWSEFSRDSNNLRLEMSSLSDADYYRKQTTFQQKLMDQPRFFKSDYFYDSYEEQARQNLKAFFELIHHKNH